MSKAISVGVIGTGYTVGIAQPHVKAYLANPNVKGVALYDIIPERAREWAERKGFQDVSICESYEQLSRYSCDTVYQAYSRSRENRPYFWMQASIRWKKNCESNRCKARMENAKRNVRHRGISIYLILQIIYLEQQKGRYNRWK